MSARAQRRDRGVTLMEVMIAVTLLSLLTLAMFIAMRVGFNTYGKTQTKLMADRRVAGAQRILQQELNGLMPVISGCGASEKGPPLRFGFFQGEPDRMRLVSTFSLQGGWRGQPQILELLVIPGEEKGVRLIVNEIPYAGPLGTAQLCLGFNEKLPIFAPITATDKSFVLADKLDYCRFSYLGMGEKPSDPGIWKAKWAEKGWPFSIRVEMAPLEPDPSRLQPVSLTAPIYLIRSTEIEYADK
jgi:prepilin-type N-terminal cleavage/methylation domain-containing protein